MSARRIDQAEFWDQRAAAWDRRAEALDLFSDDYGRRALEALDPQPGWRVLDIGCGPGTTTVELARRVAPDGEAIGIDISEAMVSAATRRATAAGVTNIRFAAVDASSASLGEELDGAYSRFGTMFFVDPAAAFANIGRSLRAGGRYAAVVWGPLEDNPWMFVPTLAAGGVLEAELTIPGPDEPGPFSLADGGAATALLERAGFVDVAVDRIDGARIVEEGRAEDELRVLLETGPLGSPYDAADQAVRQAAVDAVMAAIETYRDGDRWRLPGSALMLTARRPDT